MPITRNRAKAEGELNSSGEQPNQQSPKQTETQKVKTTEKRKKADNKTPSKEHSNRDSEGETEKHSKNASEVISPTNKKAKIASDLKAADKQQKVHQPQVQAETSKSELKAVPSTGSTFFKLFEDERQRTAKSILEFKFNKSRARILNGLSEVKSGSNGIIYWMFRDQRVQDNWAFLFAQKLALKNKIPLHVCFCLLPKFLDANTRHYRFLVKGLQEIEAECKKLNISFQLFYGDGGTEVPKFVQKHSMGAIICDFCPLRVPMQWVENLKKDTPADIPIIQVDAHNIVPVWITSDKQEYAARTIRNKIVKKLADFLTEFPPMVRHPFDCVLKNVPQNDWNDCWKHVDIDELDDVKWAIPGYTGGIQQLEEFCTKKLEFYNSKKNDPTQDVLSDLAPWFHFGNFLSPL